MKESNLKKKGGSSLIQQIQKINIHCHVSNISIQVLNKLCKYNAKNEQKDIIYFIFLKTRHLCWRLKAGVDLDFLLPGKIDGV